MRKFLLFFPGILLILPFSLFAEGENTNTECTTYFADSLRESFLPAEKIFISSNFFLVKKEKELEEKIQNFSDAIEQYSGNCSPAYRNILGNRLLALKQTSEMIVKTLAFRRNPIYRIPVLGGYINPSLTALPNADRSYRASSTDGIHHGIDFYGNFGTSVISASDGVVVRIVMGFETSWFGRITTGTNLSDYEKSKNLDVYRGNQIWILAPDGSVATYAHLSEISNTLFVGKNVALGENLGKIGVSGVPGASTYRNYHLHFEMYKNNEYDIFPTIENIHLWDWRWHQTPKSELFSSISAFFGQ